jgi:RHS repeat-associated protein
MGEIYEQLEYTPYGELWVEHVPVIETTPFRFTGKERDSETGLYYYGARYLNPQTSMWLSADPAMGEYIPQAPINDEAKKYNQNLPGMGGVFNYVNLHAYHYAGNNPVKLTDPDGRELDITFEITSYEKTPEGITAYGKLTIIDRDTGETVTAHAYSSGRGHADDGVSLPIPLGNYEILEPTRVNNFYRLEAIDFNQGDDRIDGTNQDHVRLHKAGTQSFGCISVDENWNKVSEMLSKTTTGKSFVLYCRGLVKLDSAKYGNLKVLVNQEARESGVYPNHPSGRKTVPNTSVGVMPYYSKLWCI